MNMQLQVTALFVLFPIRGYFISPVFETRILGLDLRNKDFRNRFKKQGFQKSIQPPRPPRPPKSPKIVYADLVFEIRILGLDYRNEDLRILGFRGFSFRNKDLRILGLSPLGRHDHSDGGVSPSKEKDTIFLFNFQPKSPLGRHDHSDGGVSPSKMIIGIG